MARLSDYGVFGGNEFIVWHSPMRMATEAMKDVGDETLKVLNELKNKIGTLSDIPQ